MIIPYSPISYPRLCGDGSWARSLRYPCRVFAHVRNLSTFLQLRSRWGDVLSFCYGDVGQTIGYTRNRRAAKVTCWGLIFCNGLVLSASTVVSDFPPVGCVVSHVSYGVGEGSWADGPTSGFPYVSYGTNRRLSITPVLAAPDSGRWRFGRLRYDRLLTIM